MTVVHHEVAEFFTTYEGYQITPGRRAKMAGAVVAASVALDSEFRGTVNGWRIVVARVCERREMVPEDIGIDPE